MLLAPEPVRLLPGVGPGVARKPEGLGITRLGQLQSSADREAVRRLRDDGLALVRRARGEDARVVDPGRGAKSISAETTLDRDHSVVAGLERPLWHPWEKLARRLKKQEVSAGGVALKLKTAGFATRSRSARLSSPTVLPDRLFDLARALLVKEASGMAFRLSRIGANPVVPCAMADQGDLADAIIAKRAATQAAIDTLRGRFGQAAVTRGRSLR